MRRRPSRCTRPPFLVDSGSASSGAYRLESRNSLNERKRLEAGGLDMRWKKDKAPCRSAPEERAARRRSVPGPEYANYECAALLMGPNLGPSNSSRVRGNGR